MARVKNGMVYSEEYMGYQYHFEWNVYGQDAEGRKIVRWKLISDCSGSYSRCSMSLLLYAVDGSLLEVEGLSPWKQAYSRGEVIDSGEIICPLGTDQIAIEGYCYINAGIGLSIAGIWELTTDYTPSPSTITCSNTTIGEAPTIVITKYDSDTYVNITYEFGTLSGTVVTGYAGEVYSGWIVPDDFYTQITDSSSKRGTMTAVSYRNGTVTGSETCSFTVKVDTEECAPTISIDIVDSNTQTTEVTKNNKCFIRGYSHATVTITATGNKGASIASYYVNNDGRTSSSATTTFNNITNGLFAITVTDTRGVSTSTTIRIDLVDYLKTTCVVSAAPPSANGYASVNISGSYYAHALGETQNTMVLKYKRMRHGDADTGTWTTLEYNHEDGVYSVDLTFDDLDYKSTYTFEAIATDLLTEATSKVSVKTIPVFSWSENDFEFNVPVNVNGVVEANGVEVEGNSSFNGQTVLSGDTTISGNFTLDADLSIDKAFTVKDMTVTNNVTVNGAVAANGKVSGGSLEVSGSAKTGTLTVTNGATITGDVTVSGNLTAGNVADYVVEQGTTETTANHHWTWKYRRWKSGFCEAWGETSSPAIPQNDTASIYCQFPFNLNYDYHLQITTNREYHAGNPGPVYGSYILKNSNSTTILLSYVGNDDIYTSQSVTVQVYLMGQLE